MKRDGLPSGPPACADRAPPGGGGAAHTLPKYNKFYYDTDHKTGTNMVSIIETISNVIQLSEACTAWPLTPLPNAIATQNLRAPRWRAAAGLQLAYLRTLTSTQQ
jgi:hypothetical protein